MIFLSFEDYEEHLVEKVIVTLEKILQKESMEIVPPDSILKFQDIEINERYRTVIRDKQEIKFTYIEFEILKLLATHPGMVFSKEQIYDIVWKEPYYGDYNIVMSHIRNIREKIEDNPSKPIYIQTVWGVGYRFNTNLSSGL